MKDGWGSVDHLISIHNIQATGFSDRIIGSSQGDLIAGNHGGDFIDGGAGVDKVVYWNRSTEFTVTYNKSDGSIDVTYMPFNQTDHLVNVEQISFQTDSVLIDVNTFKPSAFQFIKGTPFNNLDRNTNPRWVIGDVNGDEILDLVIRYDPASSFMPNMVGHSPLQAFLGSRSGAFIKSDAYFANVPEPTLVNTMVQGDFNKDGKVDIAVAASGQDAYENGKPIGPWSGEPSYFLFSSKTGYSAYSDPAIPSIFAHHASVGDINHDGYDDIYISSLTNAPSYVFLSDATGGYHVDRNILPDVIAMGPVNHSLASKPDGTSVFYYPSWTSDLLADFNNDGWDDLAVLPSGAGGPGLIFLNDKTGKFSEQSMMTLPPGPYGASLQYVSPTGTGYDIGTIFLDSKVIDLNNDGLNDIISITTSTNSQEDDFVYYRGSSLQILINKSGSFSDETSARTDFLHISNPGFTFEVQRG